MDADSIATTYLFQSTLPVWGATDNLSTGIILGRISIHAPRVGSDLGGLH